MDVQEVAFLPPPNKSYQPTQQVLIVGSSHTGTFEAYTPNSSGSRNRWRSFEHYRVQKGDPQTIAMPCKLYYVVNNEYTTFTGQIPGSLYAACDWTAFGDPGLPIEGLPGMYVVREDGGFVPAPLKLDELEAMAARHMLPIIKSELSLVNSLLELRDFKTLPQTARRLGTFCTQVQGAFRYKLQETRKWAIGRLLRRAPHVTSDSYLQTQFNIRPAISDICGIHAAMTRLDRRINDLLTREGRHQVKHFTCHLNEFDDTFETKDDHQVFAADYSQWPTEWYYHTRRRVWYEPSTFHAEIRYNYLFSEFQRQHAALLGLLDSLGVNINPSIIWNAIPWTFVVDWVIGVSRWLDQFKLSLLEPTINIHSYLWSIRRRRRIALSRFYPVQRSQSYEGPEATLPLIHETAYRRQVGQMGISSILSSGLTLKEISLGAALVISRRRFRHNRNR